mmetsp:Transcript_25640/g.55726  ORF Transcript_25640/g.55726 Transcript_25640/m.55726 type:complete len:109 (+) Transcript_25640:1281-1607(+)
MASVRFHQELPLTLQGALAPPERRHFDGSKVDWQRDSSLPRAFCLGLHWDSGQIAFCLFDSPGRKTSTLDSALEPRQPQESPPQALGPQLLSPPVDGDVWEEFAQEAC